MQSKFDAAQPSCDARLQPGLCFGGSFNPIHNGHLQCARAAALNRGFHRIVVIPSAQPPHKPQSADLAPAADRFAMSRLACEFCTDRSVTFVPSDIEIARTGPSYTLLTVRELRRSGWQEVWWLIGADMLNFLPKWYKIDELLNEVNFLILARPGVELKWDTLPASYRQRLQDNVVPAPLVDVSATEIRERVRQGLSVDHLTVPPVVDYIRANRLYL